MSAHCLNTARNLIPSVLAVMRWRPVFAMQQGETVALKTSCRNALPTLTGVLQTVLRLLPRLAQHLQGALPIRRMRHHPRLLRNLSLRVAASIPIAM